MKYALAILAMILIIGGGVIGFLVYNNSINTNDNAQKDKDGRFLTIINNTGQIINEVHITVGNGREIEEMKKNNPDEDSFSIKIPEQYNEFDTFNVTVIDRYNMKYQKEVNNVSKKGITEVTIGEENYIEGKGDFFNKLDRLFNGD